MAKPLNATLIHHTGTFIRFRKTDAASLPPAERKCEIELPDGRVVAGKFAGNRDLFNVNGPELIRWIKSWLPDTKSARVVVHPVGTADKIRLELLGASPAALSSKDRRSLLARAPKTKGLAGDRKRQEFSRWERDPALRRFVRGVWGSRCQVVGCSTQDAVSKTAASDSLVDVHHLMSVSLRGDDSPANLVVLCMMHHGLIHRSSGVTTTVNVGSVRIAADGVRFEMKRDLETLNRAMSWRP
ncbi:hypothetical protein [Nocardioides renjunii]|uniref:hypothetical protein n=1 Tax=Nocardioides renjunii TaxID=3095075 RepID=UPI002AFF0AD0|nr:hypothetical protein [Nocardioides sp. S-34]WQQ22392.1 hypothetical protein SHK17_00065 [Nocardioides sp. S-34]